MVNGLQAWDMREFGNICLSDACRLSRFSFGDVVPEHRERVGQARVDVQVINMLGFDYCRLLATPCSREVQLRRHEALLGISHGPLPCQAREENGGNSVGYHGTPRGRCVAVQSTAG